MESLNLFYKVSGKFAVYLPGIEKPVTELFINKIIDVTDPQAALNIALNIVQKRANRKFGKGATVEQINNIRLQKSGQAKRKNKKKKIKEAQMEFPY